MLRKGYKNHRVHWRRLGAQCMEVSHWWSCPSLWLAGLSGQETSSSSCWIAEQVTAPCGRCRYCLVLRGVIGCAWQGHGTSTFGPVLTPVLPEVSLILHTVKFSKYSAVKKSTSLCSTQLFSDVFGHRLLFAPVIPTNIDLNWCPCFVGECSTLSGATLRVMGKDIGEGWILLPRIKANFTEKPAAAPIPLTYFVFLQGIHHWMI